MKTIRWFFATLTLLILVILLGIGVPSTAIAQQLTHSTTVKSWLEQSEVYDKILNLVIAERQNDILTQDLTNFSLLNTEQAIAEIKKSIPATFIQRSFETVIDAYYAYFEGRTDKIEFAIDLNEVDKTLKTNLFALIQENLETLPTCPGETAQDYQKFQQGECIPPSVDRASVSQQLEKNLQQDLSLIPQATFTEQDLALNYEDLSHFKTGFSSLKILPQVTFVLVALCSILLVGLVPHPKWGYLLLGASWIVTTLLIFPITFVLRTTLTLAAQEALQTSVPNQVEDALNEVIFSILNTAFQNIGDRVFILAGGGLLFGIACIILAQVRFSSLGER